MSFSINPSGPIATKKDFLVKVAKGGIIEFTQDHLNIHKKHFNEENRPEYFQDLHPYGIDYTETIMEESTPIDACQQGLGLQMFRKGNNPEIMNIKNSVLMTDYDLRQKPLQALLDEDGAYEYLFNGNTMHRVLSKFTNVQNRLVAVYKKNKYFSIPNLRLIGGYSNSLDYPSGLLSFTDLSKIVKEYLSESGITERFKKGLISQDEFLVIIDKKFTFVSNGRQGLEKNQIKQFKIDTIKNATGEEDLLMCSSGVEMLKWLVKNRPSEWTSSKHLHYHGISANMDKWFDGLSIKERNLQDAYNNGIANAPKPGDVTVCVIIHMGTPDPQDPILNFFTTYLKFYQEFIRVHKFIEEKYYRRVGIHHRHNHKLVGAFQQVKEIDTLEFGSVVSFDDVINDYKVRYPKGELLDGIV